MKSRAPPPALPWPSNHLKLQVRITNRPKRMSPPPPPALTFDLVSLTDTQGGNMMQRYFAQMLFKTLFVVFSVELKGIVKNLLQLFLMWHCVTMSGISLLITEKVLQPPGVTYDLHFFT